MDPEFSCAMVDGLGKNWWIRKNWIRDKGIAEHPCFLIRDSGRDLVLQQYVLVQSPERVSMRSWALRWAIQGYGQTSPPKWESLRTQTARSLETLPSPIRRVCWIPWEAGEEGRENLLRGGVDSLNNYTPERLFKPEKIESPLISQFRFISVIRNRSWPSHMACICQTCSSASFSHTNIVFYSLNSIVTQHRNVSLIHTRNKSLGVKQILVSREARTSQFSYYSMGHMCERWGGRERGGEMEAEGRGWAPGHESSGKDEAA